MIKRKISQVTRAALLSMLVAAFGVVSTGAYALSNSTSVVNSGDNADIETEVESETEVDVENDNDADVHQYVKASSNTGGNDANGNIGSGTSIDTGNATTEVKADVDANSNKTFVGLGDSWGTTNMTDIVNTGDNADVETEVEKETEIDVDNDNDAWVKQRVKADADTGHNDANGNIGSTSVDTGNAQVGTKTNADVNSNFTLIGGDYGEGNSGLLNNTVITNTGKNADIESEAESETDIDVENDNDLEVWQSLYGKSNSGKNDANGNIGGSEIMTGSALLLSKMNVSGNSNATGIGGSAVSPSSSNFTDIVNTGDNLDSEGETEVEMKVKVNNDSELYGSQWFKVKSDTGKNDANGNVGGSLIDSGHSGSGANVGMSGNANETLIGSLGSLFTLLDFLSL